MHGRGRAAKVDARMAEFGWTVPCLVIDLSAVWALVHADAESADERAVHDRRNPSCARPTSKANPFFSALLRQLSRFADDLRDGGSLTGGECPLSWRPSRPHDPWYGFPDRSGRALSCACNTTGYPTNLFSVVRAKISSMWIGAVFGLDWLIDGHWASCSPQCKHTRAGERLGKTAREET
jgi:hypothetical protein